MNFNPNKRGLKAPWQKGQPSPNPSGRPKRLPISDAYTEKGEQPVPTSIRKMLQRRGVTLPPNATYADALVESQYLEAFGGNCTAAKEIREAIEGKAGQRIEPQDAVDTVVRIELRETKAPILNPLAGTMTLRNSIMGKDAAKTPAPPSPKAPERGE